MRTLLLCFLLFFSGGCEKSGKISSWIDSLVFSAMGGTVFTRLNLVTMKEIHLDKGALVGQDVMIEGQVIDTGRYDTYMVMSDATARMLVVLTDVDDAARVRMKAVGAGKRPVRVIGTVEYGKKGLPFIQAINLIVRDGAQMGG